MDFRLKPNTFPTITDLEFSQFKKLIYDLAGIDLAPSKKMLVAGRLSKRLRHYQLGTYSEYYKLVTGRDNPEERQIMVDLLTTNETYFYREPDHFHFLEQKILPAWSERRTFRAWSAAASSGEEAYTIGMILMEKLGEYRSWEVVGTDISQRMVEMAQNGHYLMDTAKILPRPYLTRYCLKGVREQEGTFLIDKKIRNRVKFIHANLNAELPNLGGPFDLIFLRNVLIYFNTATKQQVVKRVLRQLRSGGYCFIGHAESLMGMNDEEILSGIYSIAPTIYRKR
jgi:chemotaxis protein methyltransferase CheR